MTPPAPSGQVGQGAHGPRLVGRRREGPLRVTVLASGRGTNLAALLAAIDAGHVDARVGLLVTDRPGAPCTGIAKNAGVAVLELPRLPKEKRADHDARLAAALAAEDPDLVVMAGYMRILGPAALGACPGRFINLHPSLLPAFPGADGVGDAWRAGAPITGCTTHLVTEDLDAGPVVLQAALAVDRDAGEDALRERVHGLEHHLLPRTVQLIAEERVHLEEGHVRIAPGGADRMPPLPGVLYPVVW